MKTLFASLLVSVLAQAQAIDIVWSQMEMNISYTDIHNKCQSKSVLRPTFYFAAELNDDDEIVRAFLQSSTSNLVPSRKVLIPTKIAKNIELRETKNGTLLVQELPLNEKLLFWIMGIPTPAIGECGPVTKLKSITPADVTYLFDVKDIGEKKTHATSNLVKFSGTTKPKNPKFERPYKATLSLSQTFAE